MLEVLAQKVSTVQLHSLPADQADLEIVLSADCSKKQERQCTRSGTGIGMRKPHGLFHLDDSIL